MVTGNPDDGSRYAELEIACEEVDVVLYLLMLSGYLFAMRADWTYIPLPLCTVRFMSSAASSDAFALWSELLAVFLTPRPSS